MLGVEADEELAVGEETNLVVRLGSEPLAAAAGGTEPSSATDSMQEVLVKGEHPPREVTKRTLGRDEIAHSPGTHGDALLSLQNLLKSANLTTFAFTVAKNSARSMLRMHFAPK